MNEDPDGFHLVFGERPCEGDGDTLKTSFVPDDAVELMMELPYFLYLKEELASEKEYIEEDVVRKYQIEYNETVCMVEKFPEAMHISEKLMGTDNSEAVGDNLQPVLATNIYTNETEDSLQAVLPTDNNNAITTVSNINGVFTFTCFDGVAT